MRELIGTILGGPAVLGLVCIGGVIWLGHRAMQRQAAEMADQAKRAGGPGGPTGPA
jgi:hypothetical protein